MRQFKDSYVDILVVTDVASRDLDISNVMHVIQYDLPNTIDDYVTREAQIGSAGGSFLDFSSEFQKRVAVRSSVCRAILIRSVLESLSSALGINIARQTLKLMPAPSG